MKDIIIGLALLFIIPSVFVFWNFLIYLDLYKPNIIKDFNDNKIYFFDYFKKRSKNESFTKKTNGKES